MAKTQSKQKRVRRGRRAPRSMGDRDIAKVHHTFAFDVPLNTGQCYAAYNFALTNSTRAVNVAKAYQYYRIAKVEAAFKPALDTFTGDTARTVPYLYYMVDKAGTFNNANMSIQALKIAGCKPHRFDDRTVRCAWKPAVYIGSSDTPSGATNLVAELSSLVKVSPWITTSSTAGEPASNWAPNSVDHMGLTFGIEGQGSSYVAGSLQFRITYEFKKPFWPGLNVPTEPPIVINLDEIGSEQPVVE